MTKDANGRGNLVPPNRLSEVLHFLRLDYERTGNPLFVWKALIIAGARLEFDRERMRETSPDLPLLPATLPEWCWQYLVRKAKLIEVFSMLNGTWEEKKNIALAEYEPLAKGGNEDAMLYLDALEKLDRAMPNVELKAKEITRKLPLILGFVDGAHSNAFLDYWREQQKKKVARVWDEAERKGMKGEEILAAVSEKTGIIDDATIRRYVKEAMGKALPRRRSNKPKAPKGKKD
jgi:hypothetical protein